jgi:hypothetical protein
MPGLNHYTLDQTHENHPLNCLTTPKLVFTRRKEINPINALPITKAFKFLLSTPESCKPETYSPIEVVVSRFGMCLKSKVVSSPRP